MEGQLPELREMGLTSLAGRLECLCSAKDDNDLCDSMQRIQTRASEDAPLLGRQHGLSRRTEAIHLSATEFCHGAR